VNGTERNQITVANAMFTLIKTEVQLLVHYKILCILCIENVLQLIASCI